MEQTMDTHNMDGFKVIMKSKTSQIKNKNKKMPFW